jgi:hypothetical protein
MDGSCGRGHTVNRAESTRVGVEGGVLDPSVIQSLRDASDRPFGFRPENPELIRMLLDEVLRNYREIDRLKEEVERLRRSIE